MQVKWLPKALENLNDEADYIAKDDPFAAKLIVQKIYAAISLLADNPALGHAGRLHGTRELVVPNTRYIIPYRVKGDSNQIQILRVFHTSRKSPKRW